MRCTHCGAEAREGAQFCMNCGQPLQAPTIRRTTFGADGTVAASADATSYGNDQPLGDETQLSGYAIPAPSATPPAVAPEPVSPMPFTVPTGTIPTPGTQPTGAMPPMPSVPGPAPLSPNVSAPAAPGTPPPVSIPAPSAATMPPTPNQQTYQGPQPTPQPGLRPSPQPGPQINLNPAVNQALKEATAPATLQTAGISLGIGLGSALVLALLAALMMLGIGTAMLGDLSDIGSGMSSDLTSLIGDSVTGPNIVQSIVMMMVAGVSGSFSFDAKAMGFSLSSAGLGIHLWGPVTLSGLALVIGAAFGAYMFARKHGIRFKWTGIISAVAVGIASGLVYLLLAAILPWTISAAYSSNSAQVTMSGASLRTFCMAFLLGGLGSLAGYALAQFAPDASNVFVAAWRWAHRVRGFVRTLVESVAIYTVVFTVIGVIMLVVLAIAGKQPSMILLLPIALPMLPAWCFVLASFGAIDMSLSGQTPQSLAIFTAGGTTASNVALWVMVVVLVLTTLYIGLRAAARNMYDRAYAGWRHSWKAPVGVLVFWLAATFLFFAISFGVDTSGMAGSLLNSIDSSITSGNMSVTPAGWYFVLAGVWAFLIEVVALTFGPTLVVSLPALWRFLVGGTVRPTPTEVSNYVTACGATFRKPRRGGQPGQPMPPANGAAVAAGTAPVPSVPIPGPYAGDATGNAPSPTPSPAAPQNAPTTVIPPSEVPVPTGPAIPPTPTTPIYPNESAASMPASPVAAPAFAPVSAPAAVAAKPLSPKQKRIILLSGIIVGVCILLGVAYGVLNAVVFSPQSVAKSYIEAIEQGNYSEANGIANPGISADRQALLTDKVGDAENALISNARVTSTTKEADGTVTAKIQYSLNGKMVDDSFRLSPAGSKFLIFKNWSVATPLLKEITVSGVPETNPSVTVNGVTVTSKNSMDASSAQYESMTFKVYPGTYNISLAKSKYLTSDTITVRTGENTNASLDVETTDELQDAVQTALDAKLDECAASTDAEPEGCPFSLYISSPSRYRNIVWSIVDYPTVDEVDTYGYFSADDGEVKVAYEYKGYDDEWNPDDGSDSLYVSGSYAIDGDDVTIDLGNY